MLSSDMESQGFQELLTNGGAAELLETVVGKLLGILQSDQPGRRDELLAAQLQMAELLSYKQEVGIAGVVNVSSEPLGRHREKLKMERLTIESEPINAISLDGLVGIPKACGQNLPFVAGVQAKFLLSEPLAVTTRWELFARSPQH
jgi:hypothetical protein